jgi:hypothetical protein
LAALVLGFSSKERLSDAEIKKRAAELGMTESAILTESVSKEEETKSSVKEAQTSDDKNTSSVKTDDVRKEDTSVKTDDADKEPTFIEPDKETVPPIINEGETDKEGEKESLNKDIVEETKEEEVTPPSINPLPSDEKGFIPGEDGVVITVIRGDSSVSVARRIYEAGLIESAVEFDKYLCDNGYDKVISVGTYNIEYGMDFDEIARVITRKN